MYEIQKKDSWFSATSYESFEMKKQFSRTSSVLNNKLMHCYAIYHLQKTKFLYFPSYNNNTCKPINPRSDSDLFEVFGDVSYMDFLLFSLFFDAQTISSWIE